MVLKMGDKEGGQLVNALKKQVEKKK